MQTKAEAFDASKCRAVVIWIDWYSYHVARFKGLQAAFGVNGEVHGIELVGGVGVHKGYNFREGVQGLPVETLCSTKGWHDASKVSLSIALVRRLSKLGPKLVLIPGYYTVPAIAAAIWCKTTGRISVLMTETTATDHVRHEWREKFKSLLIRSLFDWAVTGGAAHDRYLLQLGFSQRRIVHFYDVVGNRHIQESVSDIRLNSSPLQHGLPNHYFLFVGRLAPEKNVIGLLDAWLAYCSCGGKWSLVIAGDGPDGPALKERLETSVYKNRVCFLGHRSARELLPVYAFASTFVLPSSREPWGLVVNEAMAANLPVIVSKRCGCSEDLVRPGQNGFVFDPSNPDILTDQLLLMSSYSEQERNRMGQVSLTLIERYTPQNFGQQIVGIADGSARSPERSAKVVTIMSAATRINGD
ncbi:glycosyltransferase [Terriglobus sp. TAA 43]|uniref:glycosyltransferase n=1 Tax=Terriglobus sp. TAA 43 TaxID=278961 RepID=UPI000689DDB4|nr:glycosyltransferase [Terriglobus sp. TAA 43]